MSQSTSNQLILIDVRKPLRRALLMVPVALSLLFSWYAVRWYIGDFVAEFAPKMEEERQLDTALAAMRLAPNDPWTHWVVAGLKKRTILPEDLEDALHHYEEAVRLSPYDYRFWMDLGRTREDVGDRAGGEKALRRAVELAPSYAYPHWYLGNLLLRAGRSEEAFAELRRAATADAALRPQLFNVAWVLYAQNIDEIKKVIGDSAAARAEFANYLLGKQRLDDALSLWSGLKPAEKKEQSESGAAIMRRLIEQKRYHAALNIFVDLNPDANAAKATQFVNGSFEDDIDTAASFFNWQMKSYPEAQIAIDGSTGHSGARSLRILFKAPTTLSFNNIAQTVVVDPATQYRFECYVRAEDLKSGGTPLIEIIDGLDGKSILGASKPLASGTYDWQQVAINFKSPPNTEAVIMRIVRATCGTDAVCPIFGIVWYDDFNFQNSDGTTGPRDSRSR
ncbi:MAG: tetratricopeptide repeat protein, partial [Acidobacteria bacterium]|nr:tetratricopeptide repeat protein [Acidobacteriota bacterium]